MKKTLLLHTLLIVLGAAALGLLDASPDFWMDALVYGLLLAACAGLVALAGKALRAAAGPRWAGWAAFWLRLAVGVILWFVLPLSGYTDNPATMSGYMFPDAYYRDQHAWELAHSTGPLIGAYTLAPAETTDQYGGLLALSGFVYRYLSPADHRPFTILILAAAAMALGTLFTWGAGKALLGEKTALAAAWIFALYPEGIILGSSQMREPFVMASLALVTYGFSQFQNRGQKWLAWAGTGLLFLLWFQSPVALIALFVLGVAYFLEPGRSIRWKQVLLFGGILVGLIAIVIAVWSSLPSLSESSPLTLFFTWLSNNFKFQSQTTEQGSGQIQRLLDLLGDNLRVVLFIAYGVTRPVLPAALSDIGANLVWYVINLLRALGWYLLVPLLGFAPLLLLTRRDIPRRRQLLWLAVITWVLIFIAAANGGADAWDNPRYRAIFLAWQALLAAWAWVRAGEIRTPWLKRLLWIEAVFVVVFTWWYLTRLPGLSPLHISVEAAVGLCLLAGAAITAIGWWRDRRRRLT